MSDNLRRYQAIHQMLKKLYPSEPKGNVAHHLNTLAAMVSGIIGSKSTHFSKIAECVVDSTKNESRIRKYWRLVKNDHIEHEIYFLPFVKHLIRSIEDCHQPYVLAIDGSQLGKGCRCLMISFLYKKRAFPLVWSVYKHKKGHFSEQIHRQLLAEVQPLIDKQAEVILLGDGEFDGIRWLSDIEDHHWKYVFRTASNAILSEDDERFNFKRISTDKESYFSFPNTYFTDEAYGPLHAILLHKKGYKDPIYLITNLELAEEAYWWYQKRFCIETFFSDQKGRGFHLHKSHLSDPLRLERLLIAAALAYIWILYLGMLVIKERWYLKLHRTDRCDLSLFTLGLNLSS